jgi:hypothetical protein
MTETFIWRHEHFSCILHICQHTLARLKHLFGDMNILVAFYTSCTASEVSFLQPFHCPSRNYATHRLSAEVAFVRPQKEEQSDWLVWPINFFYWPWVLILQTDAKCIQCFKKHAKLIENWFSRSTVQLTRVWELLTRRWNAWHRESHCVFTAGGERVN